MGLYALVFNRWLYGIFCRALARFFDPKTKAVLDLGEGHLFRVYLNDGYWTRFFLYHRDYEPEVAKVLDAARGHSDVFCDLGANSGLWSVQASRGFSQVIAVEASRTTYERLKENVDDLPNVDHRHAAIHQTSGDVLQFVNVHNSHASAHLDAGRPAGALDTVEQVETLSVDDAVPAGTSALIKLDVEGAEIAAIDGATRAMRDGAVFIYEDHGSDRMSEVSRRMLSIPGMCIYAIDESVQVVHDTEQLERLKTDRYKGYNFLAGQHNSPLLTAILERFAKDDRGR